MIRRQCLGKVIPWVVRYHKDRWQTRRTEYVLRKEDVQKYLGFWDYPIQARRPNLVTDLHSFRFSNLQSKIKKKKEWLDTWTLTESLWNINMIPIIVGSFQTSLTNMAKRKEELDIRRIFETTQTAALPRSARIHWRVFESWGDWDIKESGSL